MMLLSQLCSLAVYLAKHTKCGKLASMFSTKGNNFHNSCIKSMT